MTWDHSMVNRYPSSAGEMNEDQIYRKYIVTATGTSITLTPTMLNGLGAPDLILLSAAISATFVGQS
jgi:hypothetical protein